RLGAHVPLLFPYTTLFRSTAIRGISRVAVLRRVSGQFSDAREIEHPARVGLGDHLDLVVGDVGQDLGRPLAAVGPVRIRMRVVEDRKSTRLNSSHMKISYA